MGWGPGDSGRARPGGHRARHGAPARHLPHHPPFFILLLPFHSPPAPAPRTTTTPPRPSSAGTAASPPSFPGTATALAAPPSSWAAGAACFSTSFSSAWSPPSSCPPSGAEGVAGPTPARTSRRTTAFTEREGGREREKERIFFIACEGGRQGEGREVVSKRGVGGGPATAGCLRACVCVCVLCVCALCVSRCVERKFFCCC